MPRRRGGNGTATRCITTRMKTRADRHGRRARLAPSSSRPGPMADSTSPSTALRASSTPSRSGPARGSLIIDGAKLSSSISIHGRNGHRRVGRPQRRHALSSKTRLHRKARRGRRLPVVPTKARRRKPCEPRSPARSSRSSSRSAMRSPLARPGDRARGDEDGERDPVRARAGPSPRSASRQGRRSIPATWLVELT